MAVLKACVFYFYIFNQKKELDYKKYFCFTEKIFSFLSYSEFCASLVLFFSLWDIPDLKEKLMEDKFEKLLHVRVFKLKCKN